MSSLAGRLDPASGLADPASRLVVLVSLDGGVSGSLPRGWRDGPVDGLGGPVHEISIFFVFPIRLTEAGRQPSQKISYLS